MDYALNSHCQHPVLVISDYFMHRVVFDIWQALKKDLVSKIHKNEYKTTQHTNFSKNLKILHLKGSNIQKLFMTVGSGIYRSITFDHICIIGGHLPKKSKSRFRFEIFDDIKWSYT